MLLLVPFILTWTIGCLGFSSFFAFLVAAGVYWGIFTRNQFIRRHTWLSEMVGKCITGENASAEEKERIYRQCKPGLNVPIFEMELRTCGFHDIP